jgi:hypothetical protein
MTKNIMISLFITAGLLASSFYAVNLDGTDMNESVEEEEWTVLFDGTSTDQWRGYNMDRFPEEAWHIEGDELVFRPLEGSGHPPYDIITREKYSDFELSLEWNISEGGNSGIFHHAIEQPEHQIYWSGIEMQLLDNDAYPNLNDNQYAGSLYDLKPAEPQNTRPHGEWNTVRIISDGANVEYWQNGEKVVEFERWSLEWFDMVRASKFECHPSFGTVPNGYIGLQDHSDEVRFRNIRIRRL